jgi:hypothetical protein
MDGFTTHYNLCPCLLQQRQACGTRSLVRPEGSGSPQRSSNKALILHARPFLTKKTVPFKYKSSVFYSPFKTIIYMLLTKSSILAV